MFTTAYGHRQSCPHVRVGGSWPAGRRRRRGVLVVAWGRRSSPWSSTMLGWWPAVQKGF